MERFKVKREGELLQALFEAMPERKRTGIRKLLSDGMVAVNGQPSCERTLQVHASDEITIGRQNGPVTTRVRDSRLEIIYEDDDFIAINKPAGLLSVAADNQRRRHEQGTSQQTAFSLMRAEVKRVNPRNELYILHRLDRDTSGVLVFAKNEQVQLALRDNWNNRVKLRRYLAWLEGILKPAEGTIRSYLAENEKYVVYSTPDPAKGKLAVTNYRTLGTERGMTLAEVNILTGRKNQIRVHMSEAGHPVVGDPRYGKAATPFGRMALHARQLQLVHPFTGRLIKFEAREPALFGCQSKEK